jgi:hypothetical protein
MGSFPKIFLRVFYISTFVDKPSLVSEDSRRIMRPFKSTLSYVRLKISPRRIPVQKAVATIGAV